MKTPITLLALLAGLGFATAADAHARLITAGPAPGASVATAPKDIRITFSEAVTLGFTGADVVNAAGEKQETGSASLDPKNPKRLIVPLSAALKPGKYTVNWHAVGDDTHRTEGHYSFDVKP
jgi:methionine-rich copper-binding protein CopC